MKYQYIFLPTLLSSLLIACSSNAPYKAIDYRGTTSDQSLTIPPELLESKRVRLPNTSPKKQVLLNALEEQQRISQQPAEVAITTSAIIHNDGVFRYLEIKAPIKKVWEKVEDFFTLNGLPIAQKDDALGMLTTHWQENRSNISSSWLTNAISSVLPKLVSSGEKDKFQAIIEPYQDKVRLYIAHYAIVESSLDKGDTYRWFYRPSEPLLELEILKRLALHLGVKKSNLKNAAPISKKAIASLSGNNTIIIDEPLDTAWRHLLQALPHRGFILERLNQSKRTIRVKKMEDLAWAPSEKDDSAEQDLEIYRVIIREIEAGKTTATFNKTSKSNHNQNKTQEALRKALANVVAMLNL